MSALIMGRGVSTPEINRRQFIRYALVGMAAFNGVGIVVFSILGIVTASLIGIFIGGAIIGPGSVILWVMVAGGIIIWKISKRRAQ